MSQAVLIDHVQGPSVATVSVAERLKFLQRVYGWMTAALLVAALGAVISIQTGLVMMTFGHGIVGAILITLAWIGLAYAARAVRHKPVVNVLAYGVYALFTGVVVSGIVFVAMLMAQANNVGENTYVLQALGLTALVFGGLTFYAFVTKRDFSVMRGFLMVGLIGLIGAGLINLFVQSSVLGLIISVGGVLIFSGYILFDTQKILKTYPQSEHVAASMELFLDFVLLFIHMLRIILYLASGRD